ncbi:MAG TPA: hypothetical protein ENJ82_15000, partial [Bacteroidetes bacterium]|nr:hypothetical protein [Bacteroidota bacterium]
EERMSGTFTAAIHNALVLWSDGRLFRLIDVGEADRVKYRATGQIDYSGPILQISEDQLLLEALKIELQLDVQAPAILPPLPASKDFVAGGGFPMLKMLLNDQEYIDLQAKQKRFRKRYQHLRSLKLAQVFIEVRATGLQNYLIQNDFEALDPARPFIPFGDEPVNGNAFYFTHPEIAGKRLEELRIDWNWLNAPESFVDYYKNYDRVEADNFNLPAAQYAIKNNRDFKVRIGLFDQRKILLESVSANPYPLFNGNDAQEVNGFVIGGIPDLIKEQEETYDYQRLDLVGIAEEEEVLAWPRYIRMELDGADFQHTRYTLVLTAQSYNKEPEPGQEASDTRSLPLNEPYVPVLKSMQVGYTARLHLYLDQAQTEAKILHLHPFGYAELAAVSSEESLPFLLPQYIEEGALYLGLAEVQPPDTVQVLFQMAEGSANPDLSKAPIAWAFMQNNRWLPFGDADIVFDHTNGLLRSGIIKFRIPEGISAENTVLPAGKVWLRATVLKDSDSVSDVINIRAQAVEAVFINADNAKNHLFKPLGAGAISTTVNSIPELAEVEQPFPSSGGKAAESDIAFYTRISERLRHKHRAISAWDYERLTLERFPDIFKAKCLPNNPYDPEMEPGLVRMVVIPDIIGRFPFNPYQPKVPAEKLVEIREYLEAYMPPFAHLKVLNPRYLQVNVRVAVGFRTGYNEGFYKAQLEEDLRHFLAPWAYQEGEDIVLGGKIYANVIVNFIEERPYIDYVGRIDLFQSSDGKNFLDSNVFGKNENLVKTDEPDVVLVSALHHEVEV